jgi:putative ABC transport system permease protein
MDDAAEGDRIFVRILLIIATLIVLIPFANVAILVYARTATRSGEIAVRSALGASRRRVVTQLFVEALVLALLAAVAGAGVTLYAWGRIEHFMDVYFGGGMPFWAEQGRNPWAVAYAVGLAVLAAVVAGVVPGLQATGKRMQNNLKQGAGGGMRLGRVWTGLVVAQVAITVAFLPIAGWAAWQAAGQGTARATFRVDDLLGISIGAPGASTFGSAILVASGGADGASDDFAQSLSEVVRRIEADPRVTGIVLSDRLPDELFSTSLYGFDRVDIDGVAPPDGEPNHRVGATLVEPGFFDFLGVPVDAGREFLPVDLTADPPPVVVNRAFVDRVLAGANPIGRYIREYRPAEAETAPWREIVGVVGELAENPLRPDVQEGRIFGPLDRGGRASAYLTVRVPSGPDALIPEVQRTVIEVDPGLRIVHAAAMTDERNPVRAGMRLAAVGMGLVLLSVLLLCTAGVFSLMSFNVTQRRREIGIRSALGASPRRVLASVMTRSAKQLSTGVAIGAVIVALMPPLSLDGLPIDKDPRLVALLAALMVGVGLAAAAGPARYGLRIQPTEALREE